MKEKKQVGNITNKLIRIGRISLRIIGIILIIVGAIFLFFIAWIIFCCWSWAEEANGWTGDLIEDRQIWKTSVHAAVPIKAGCIIKANQVIVKQEQLDFPLAEPREIKHVVGRKTKVDLDPSIRIQDEDLESDDNTLRIELRYYAAPHDGQSIIDMHYIPVRLKASCKQLIDKSGILRQTTSKVEFPFIKKPWLTGCGSYLLNVSTKTGKKSVEWSGDNCPAEIIPLVKFLEQHGDLVWL